MGAIGSLILGLGSVILGPLGSMGLSIADSLGIGEGLGSGDSGGGETEDGLGSISSSIIGS